MKTRTLAHVVTALLGTTIMIPAVTAQSSDEPIMAVYDRARPDYDAPGVRSGSFLFKPSVTGEGKFDSNIYASDGNEVDDFIAIIKPSLKIDSDWNNNSFSLFADAAIAKYADNGSEDYEDINVGANGRIDITRGTNITTDLTYSDGHEDRGSADNIGSAAAPTNFSLLKAAVGFKRDEGLVSFALNGDYSKQDFDNAALIGGGTLRNDDRDREIVNGSARLGYHVNDEYEAFVKFTGTKVTYTNKPDAGDARRDSDGYDIVGGTAFKLTGTAEGEVFVGYVKRDYDSANFGDISDFKFGASLLWTPTGLTSARIAVNRDVIETTLSSANSAGVVVSASGILSTLYSLDLQHELQRNLLLNAKGSYTKMDFTNTLRTDDLINVGLGVKYLMNRNFSVNATYTFDKRDTTDANQDYNRHSFILGLSAGW